MPKDAKVIYTPPPLGATPMLTLHGAENVFKAMSDLTAKPSAEDLLAESVPQVDDLVGISPKAIIGKSWTRPATSLDEGESLQVATFEPPFRSLMAQAVGFGENHEVRGNIVFEKDRPAAGFLAGVVHVFRADIAVDLECELEPGIGVSDIDGFRKFAGAVGLRNIWPPRTAETVLQGIEWKTNKLFYGQAMGKSLLGSLRRMNH